MELEGSSIRSRATGVLRCPAYASQGPVADSTSCRGPQLDPAAREPTRVKVLLVDDDRGLLLTLMCSLPRAGFQVQPPEARAAVLRARAPASAASQRRARARGDAGPRAGPDHPRSVAAGGDRRQARRRMSRGSGPRRRPALVMSACASWRG